MVHKVLGRLVTHTIIKTSEIFYVGKIVDSNRLRVRRNKDPGSKTPMRKRR